MIKSPSKFSIVIIDDHPLVREGLILRLSLQSDLSVCGEAASEDEGFTLIQEFQPDLALIDITLKNGNGIDLVKRVKAHHPETKILVVSGFQESLYAERALRAGALGFLSKQESNDNVLDAIRTVLSGQQYCSPEVSERLSNQSVESAEAPEQLLTDREREVFQMIGEGLATGEIANRLFLSTHTVDTHRQNIKRKLNLKTAGELNRAAVQWTLSNS